MKRNKTVIETVHLLPIAFADQEAYSLEDQTGSTKPCSFSGYFLRLFQASMTPCCSTVCLLRNPISFCCLTVRTLLFSSEVTISSLLSNNNPPPLLCFSISDECSVRKGGCSHECLVAPGKGVVCSCPSGFQLGSDGRTCEVLDYCTKHLRCSQVCEQHKNTVKCSCYPGWSLGLDGDSCHSTGKLWHIVVWFPDG